MSNFDVNNIGTMSGVVADRFPVISNDTILSPTFETTSNPTIQLSEIRERRFNIIDREQIRIRQEIQAEEDSRIFNAISAIGQEAINLQIEAERERMEIEHLRSARRIINAIFELGLE